MGSALVVSGLIFIFLAKVKNLSDEDMTRALSVYADSDKARAGDTWNNHKGDVKDAAMKAAVNNKDVIA